MMDWLIDFSEPLREHEAYGFVAAAFTTIAFLPQAYRVWSTGEVGDLSLSTFTLYAWGLALWAVYGYLLDDRPTILSGLIGLVPVLYIWWVIRRKNKLAEEIMREESSGSSKSSSSRRSSRRHKKRRGRVA